MMNNKFDIQGFSVYVHTVQLLRSISVTVPVHKIFGVIGPAGSGKTTFLRALNRMNDLEFGFRSDGKILMDGEDIYSPSYDVVALRRKVGMVFALPVPLPLSIYENVIYGPSLQGSKDSARLDELVEKSLKSAFLWEEVKDRLNTSGMRLSGGQQQRLCLARVLAMEPDVILLDEPCSGLDPISTAKIEDALTELKKDYTIILVTNNTKQAARISDITAFFLMAELIELGPTETIFTAPRDKRTNDYITGRFG
jgi:phosphate transport system ATP-binding protein